MENFERIMAIVASTLPLVLGVVTLVVQAVNKPDVTTKWGQVQLIIARIFSLSTFKNGGAVKGFEMKLPLQSATPKLNPEVDNAVK
jgi:hypothetical protein